MREGRCLTAGGALGLSRAEPRVTELAAAVVAARVSWSGTRWSRFFPGGAPSTARHFGTCLALWVCHVGCASGCGRASARGLSLSRWCDTHQFLAGFWLSSGCFGGLWTACGKACVWAVAFGTLVRMLGCPLGPWDGLCLRVVLGLRWMLQGRATPMVAAVKAVVRKVCRW